MQLNGTYRNWEIAALLCCALFLAIGLPWIDRPGIQTDEALFAGGIYGPFHPPYVIEVAGDQYPLMVMPYVGALKSYLWAAVFEFWDPSPRSVRLPAVLLGALSVWWVFSLMRRTLGYPAALVCSALLATDPLYVLYSRWDHGPVVIQHLCLVGAMLALVRFHQERRAIWLGAGFFALGLGMWEKAIFAWVLIGLSASGLILFRKQIRAALSLRNTLIAGLSFSLGAAPLIVYNVREDFVTFRGNTVWSTQGFKTKVRLLGAVLDGEALFGSIVRDTADGPAAAPANLIQKATERVAMAAGAPRRTILLYLVIAALLLVPLVWRTPARTAAAFVSLCCGVAWVQMALLQGAGGAAHHVILLWPLPAMGISAVLAAAAAKVKFGSRLLAAGIAAACLVNLLVLSTYYTNLLRYGGTPSWTEAMYPAFQAIRRIRKEAVCTVDWGFSDTLRLFERGRSHLYEAGNPVSEEGRKIALYQISHPLYVFLTHTAGNESFPGITARLLAFAAEHGFRPANRRTFADRNGRETVEIFQFEPSPP